MDTTLTRRSFVKWGTATVGATALVGFTGCAPGGGKAEDASEGTQQKAGEWLNAPCYNNCSCGSSRCLNRVYVEDGVPLKIRTDEESEDMFAMPQRRSCLRGRAKISEVLSPARIKYPM
ncbi:MAG: molybdopterin guanine dinucleotide-containing S/N-oxide reductase, partial [Eggerthella lenta]